MAETPREVRVRITADTSQFEAAMRSAVALAGQAARRLKLAPSPWQPRSWYSTSERAS